MDVESLKAKGKNNVDFDDLLGLCKKLFKKFRTKGDHFIFSTGIKEDPIVDIQPDKNNKAKSYQVAQVRKIIKRLESDGKI